MSDCCLPNLGCLAIPIVNTDVAGLPGQNGISPTIEVGDVTTGAPGDPVVVTNVSTDPSVAIFDFEIPQGTAGTNGAPGADGASLLFSTEGINRTTAGWGTLLGYGPSLPANTLANVGDRVVFEAGINHYYQYTGTSTKITYADVRLLLNGASVTLSVYPVAIENKGAGCVLKATKIWITSNLDPKDWYPACDYKTIDALLRRLNVIYFE